MRFPNLSCFYSGVSGIGTQTRDSQSGRLSVGMEKTPFSQQHTIMIPHSIQYQYNQYHSLGACLCNGGVRQDQINLAPDTWTAVRI